MKQVFLLLTVFLSFLTYAQDGVLDVSFGTSGVATGYLRGDGTTGTVTANNTSDITKIIVQPDGKIIQVGHKSTSSGGDNFIIIRYNVDGSVDGPFGNNNPYGFTDHNLGGQDRAHGVALQSDGKIVVVGETLISGENRIAMARYTTTGAIDNSFGSSGNGIVITDLSPSTTASCGAFAVKIDASHNIYVVGYSRPTTNNDFVLLKYESNGALDVNFGSSGIVNTDFASADDAAADLILGESYIYVGGTGRSGTTDYFALASYTYSGALNSSFNATGKLLCNTASNLIPGNGRSLAVSDKIYITGYSTAASADFTVASYTLTGVLNTDFRSTGIVRDNIISQDFSRSILIQCDAKILVGGGRKKFRGYLEICCRQVYFCGSFR